MVGHFGFQVIGAADGEQTVKVFKGRGDDVVLVIMDLTMPNMDGMCAFHELKKIGPDVRVILSSGYSEQSVSERFSGDKPAGFDQKPYTAENLKSRIARVVEIHP